MEGACEGWGSFKPKVWDIQIEQQSNSDIDSKGDPAFPKGARVCDFQSSVGMYFCHR